MRIIILTIHNIAHIFKLSALRGSKMRMNISVPDDLKNRMNKTGENVNWSAEACRAFEDKLAELAAKKERKTMADVITRLRASKRKTDDRSVVEGRAMGREWAGERAEAKELETLESTFSNSDSWYDQNESSAYSPGELLYFSIYPEMEGDRAGAEAFWQAICGDDTSPMNSASFVNGFIEGALELWEEVKPNI